MIERYLASLAAAIGSMGDGVVMCRQDASRRAFSRILPVVLNQHGGLDEVAPIAVPLAGHPRAISNEKYHGIWPSNPKAPWSHRGSRCAWSSYGADNGSLAG
jgi:hypothetical protein